PLPERTMRSQRPALAAAQYAGTSPPQRGIIGERLPGSRSSRPVEAPPITRWNRTRPGEGVVDGCHDSARVVGDGVAISSESDPRPGRWDPDLLKPSACRRVKRPSPGPSSHVPENDDVLCPWPLPTTGPCGPSILKPTSCHPEKR